MDINLLMTHLDFQELFHVVDVGASPVNYITTLVPDADEQRTRHSVTLQSQ